MRVMVIVKASAESEAGILPSPDALEAMGAYNNELIAAGVMLDGAGLKASANGARVNIRNGQAIVTDGPFAETEELLAGYWLWQVASLLIVSSETTDSWFLPSPPAPVRAVPPGDSAGRGVSACRVS